MAAARRTRAVEWFWKIHLPLYRWSGGRLGGRVMGMPVLLLDTVGRERIAVRAREATGAEREQLWAAVVTKAPDYAEYQARTERRIPVVVLERRQAR